MSRVEIVPFDDDHGDGAAALLAARHARHLAAEPLLARVDDFREQVERELRAVGASGAAALESRRVAGYLIGRRLDDPLGPFVRVEPAGHAVEEPEHHVLTWAHEHGYAAMTTDWRMTNLLASRFWPRRGFRETFLRLYRSIP